MEKKVAGQGIKQWLNNLLKRGEPQQPHVVSLHDHVLETFAYEGYDIEVLIYPDRTIHLMAFLKGQHCLDGWYSEAEGLNWGPLLQAAHVPGYKVRAYLKQYALQRINKE